MIHTINKSLMSRIVTVDVVGAGGNGAQFVSGLARIAVSLKALGHPGINARLWDDDKVEDANVGRQLFSMSDVGQFKSNVLIHRINTFYGLDWESLPYRFGKMNCYGSNIIVGCVDSRASRKAIHTMFEFAGVISYWLDLGNDSKTGQFILGEPTNKRERTAFRLPTAADLFPDLINTKLPADDAPSCSLAAALGRQDLFVNQMVATNALNLLWSLFRHGGVDYHGGFVNLESGRVNPLAIDADVWERMGYFFRTKPPIRKIVHHIRKHKFMITGRAKLECGHIVDSDGKKSAHCFACHRQGKK